MLTENRRARNRTVVLVGKPEQKSEKIERKEVLRLNQGTFRRQTKRSPNGGRSDALPPSLVNFKLLRKTFCYIVRQTSRTGTKEPCLLANLQYQVRRLEENSPLAVQYLLTFTFVIKQRQRVNCLHPRHRLMVTLRFNVNIKRWTV